MNKFFNRFAKDESGVTAMEYGMIAALIAVVILGAVGEIGGRLNGAFLAIQNALPAAPTP